jgi:MYXO-CTERM domain-containing protein
MIGQACENPNYGWVPWQFGVTGRDDLTADELSDDLAVSGSGCSTSGRSPTGWAALGLALVLGWRRRDSGEPHITP